MRFFFGLTIIFLFFLGWGCQDSREWRTRNSVKKLVDADDSIVQQATELVVAFGRYALPEIEQQMPSISPEQKLRLLEAVRQINEVEAVGFLRVLVRWSGDQSVREKSKQVIKELEGCAKH
ncbi:MAG: hypothetical protein V1754_04485 [Pseudomonadota bacterium]